tara:strand:+ start:1222 stop:1566 length:345 start_codon:yes stop_codon:yes gene_type:complete
MDNPSKDKIIAASSGWVATILNFIPGLGTGYLYQRRWVPYVITGGIATAWIVLSAIVNGETEPTKTEQIISIGGLVLISITTMVEAKIAHKKAIGAIEKKLQANPQKKQRALFK